MGKIQHVSVQAGGVWELKGSGNSRATKRFASADDAIVFGMQMARKHNSELCIHGEFGDVCIRSIHGRDPYPPKG
jgi:hypothetical protein